MKETLNLLSSKTAAGTTGKKGFFTAVAVAIICYLVVISGLRIKTGQEVKRIISEKDSFSAVKAALQAKIGAVRSAVSTAKPSALTDIANDLQNSRPWSMVISEISTVVPEKVWLASVDTRQETGSIIFKGYASGQMDVASFISALEKSDFFEGVEIVSSQKGAREHVFELKAKMTWPGRN